MIRPHFDYGDFMIESGTQNKIDKLEHIQNKIVRMIEYVYDDAKRENINVLKLRYNIEKLEIRRKRSLLKIMFSQSHMIENIDSYRPELN